VAVVSGNVFHTSLIIPSKKYVSAMTTYMYIQVTGYGLEQDIQNGDTRNTGDSKLLKMQGRREIGRNVGSRVMKVRNMKFAN
jgi:hypothetical protein